MRVDDQIKTDSEQWTPTVFIEGNLLIFLNIPWEGWSREYDHCLWSSAKEISDLVHFPDDCLDPVGVFSPHHNYWAPCRLFKCRKWSRKDYILFLIIVLTRPKCHIVARDLFYIMKSWMTLKFYWLAQWPRPALSRVAFAIKSILYILPYKPWIPIQIHTKIGVIKIKYSFVNLWWLH